MRRSILSYLLSALLLLGTGWVSAADLCLEGICIGDNLETLNVKWKTVPLSYDDEKFVETELAGRKVMDVYYDYNELMVTSDQVLKSLLPYVIHKQRFDQKVLNQLSTVRAICSPLTLTGELEHEGDTRLYVTFRAIADNGKRGALRVVRLEQQFKLNALRVRGSKVYKQLKQDLETRFPGLVHVRDIDGRANSAAVASAKAILGFRFISDVSNPLILKLLDVEDIPSIETDENASPLCSKFE